MAKLVGTPGGSGRRRSWGLPFDLQADDPRVLARRAQASPASRTAANARRVSPEQPAQRLRLSVGRWGAGREIERVTGNGAAIFKAAPARSWRRALEPGSISASRRRNFSTANRNSKIERIAAATILNTLCRDTDRPSRSNQSGRLDSHSRRRNGCLDALICVSKQEKLLLCLFGYSGVFICEK